MGNLLFPCQGWCLVGNPSPGIPEEYRRGGGCGWQEEHGKTLGGTALQPRRSVQTLLQLGNVINA